jgi:peptidoglycan/LPS O-acetylase OafA/YrhL
MRPESTRMMPTERPRLDCLDVARGGAAMLVLLEHGLHWSVPEYLEFSKANVVIGQAAIMVLFMVSAFVVPMSLSSKQSLSRFWQRRAFRLLPVYWCSIALAFVALSSGSTAGIATTLGDTGTWLANLTLTQRVLRMPDIWGVFWSLHFEVGLYVLVSLLFASKLLPRIGPRTLFIVLAVFALVMTATPLVSSQPPGDGGLRMALLAMLFGFAAQLHIRERMSRHTFFAFAVAVFSVPLAAEAVTVMLTPHGSGIRAMRYAVIMGTALGAFTGLLELRHLAMPRRLVALGQRSYPIYLMHPFVLTILAPIHLSAVVFVPVLIVVTLVLAEAVHRLVENPGIALGRRLERDEDREVEPVLLKFPQAIGSLRKAA